MDLGIGFGLRARGPRVVVAKDFRVATRSGGVFTLPSILAITCATTSRTTQTSASTLQTGYGANAARARSVDGSTWGLSVECARTNQLKNSETVTGSNWASGAMTRAGSQTDPAGGANAIQWTSTGDTYSDYDTGGLAARVVSCWAKRVSGSSPSAHLRWDSTGGAAFADITATTWARVSAVMSGDVGGNYIFETRDIPAGAGVLAGTRVFQTYAPQAEPSCLYPSSYIPTPDATKTRDADVLAVASPAVIAPGGFFDLMLLIAPNYASSEIAFDHDLLYFGANDRLFVNTSDHKVYLRIGGADVASSVLTWSREQALVIRAEHTPRRRALTIVGATSGDGITTGSAAAAITLPGTAYLLGNSSGAQECADLRALAFYYPT